MYGNPTTLYMEIQGNNLKFYTAGAILYLVYVCL